MMWNLAYLIFITPTIAVIFKSAFITSCIMFVDEIPEIKEKIWGYLDKIVLNEPGNEVEAARYVALNRSANLWRPLLTIATARDYGVGDLRKVISVASVVELVHAASLIEDDIADESSFRRGISSCHIKFGDNLAHLAQMYLVQKAYNLLLGDDIETNLGDGQKIAITRLASESGIGMIKGQAKDVMQKELGTVDDVVKMYEEKSGALIGLALACGGIVARAYSDVESLRKLGVAMGVSYQIVDDALDSFAQKELIGKPVKQDGKKRTLLNLVGLNGVRELKELKDREIDRHVSELRVDSTCLNVMINRLRDKHKGYI